MFFIVCKDGVQLYGDQMTWDQAKGQALEHGGILSAGLRDDEDFKREMKGAESYLYFREAQQANTHRLGPAGWLAIQHPPRVLCEVMAAFFPSESVIAHHRAKIDEISEERPRLVAKAAELRAAVNAGQVDQTQGNAALVNIESREWHLGKDVEALEAEIAKLSACAGKVFTVRMAMTEDRFLLSEPEKDANRILGQNPEGWIGAAPK